MKSIRIVLAMVTAVTLMAACGKTYNNGTGNLCKCAGGISGAGLNADMGNISHQEAEVKCAAYNQPNVTDGYHDCHLE